MRHTIVEKLKRHLSHAPQTEGDVVYTMVEIRKLLEHSCAKEKYATLTFFCDWAVHVELSRSSGGRKILQTLDEVLGRYDSKHPENLDPDGKVFALVSLDLFNRQLNQFCKDAGLPMDWTDDWRLWQKFALLYSEVIREVPVTITREDYPFKYLTRLELSNLEPAKAVVDANPGKKYVGFNWKFTLNDGTTFKLPYTSNLIEG